MTKISQKLTVSEEIFDCLDLDCPKSFFLFAGAGSGKTRALVEVLKKAQQKNVEPLRMCGQKIAIITYTNAACDEITRRLDYDSTFTVSTIHSFSWELIRPYVADIKEALRGIIREDIAKLEEKQRKGHANSKAALDRPKQIESKKRRLGNLGSIKVFTYNPNGESTGKDSLNHAEVIKISAELLNKSLLQKLLVRKFPILLIDESQDTQKDLITAFFSVQALHAKYFTLGLFGDTMQRIYMDGKLDLDKNIPGSWSTPVITLNHRCPRRVITLINKIRAQVDDRLQSPPSNAIEGFVRLFIISADSEQNKAKFESEIGQKMADITSDSSWHGDDENIKVLTLEHHMAASRGNFNEFFFPLYSVDKLKTGLLNGKLSGIPFFAQQVLPLIKALKSNDKFSVAQIVRKHSPLLTKETLESSKRPLEEISKAKVAVESLYNLWNEERDPNLIDILQEVFKSKLFHIPDVIMPSAIRKETIKASTLENQESDSDPVIDAWDNALSNPFSQFEAYVHYISDQSRFGTHQGIKGLEFPRVMVILDDDDARGNSFSYEKLFGAKAPSKTDLKNEADGKETSIDKTRRLFYVTCSRAKESLAIVAYTKDPEKVKSHVINQGWFDQNEVIELKI